MNDHLVGGWPGRSAGASPATSRARDLEIAELRASNAAREWQPIETAPKDKAILVAYGVTVTEAKWELNGWRTFCCGHLREDWPTHWMPRPKPPESR